MKQMFQIIFQSPADYSFVDFFLSKQIALIDIEIPINTIIRGVPKSCSIINDALETFIGMISRPMKFL